MHSPGSSNACPGSSSPGAVPGPGGAACHSHTGASAAEQVDPKAPAQPDFLGPELHPALGGCQAELSAELTNPLTDSYCTVNIILLKCSKCSALELFMECHLSKCHLITR